MAQPLETAVDTGGVPLEGVPSEKKAEKSEADPAPSASTQDSVLPAIEACVRKCAAELSNTVQLNLDSLSENLDVRFQRLEVLFQSVSGEVGGGFAELPPLPMKTKSCTFQELSPSSDFKTNACETDLDSPVSRFPTGISGGTSSSQGAMSRAKSVKTFTVRSELLQGFAPTAPDDMNISETMSRSRTSDFTNDAAFHSFERSANQEAYPFIISPSGTKRLVWDLCGLALISYDLFAIPIDLAFHPPRSTFSTVAFWTALVFWNIDFVLSFFTGFYYKGREELRWCRIVKHYATGWMFFDMIIVSTDWIAWISQEGRAPALARLGKSLRILRVVRSLRLLRLVKLQKLIERLLDHIESEHFIILIGMMKGTIFVLGMNHIIACIWYALSRSTGDAADAWVIRANFDQEDSIGYRYLTSLHWSLTQFTPASMEVFPRNVHERLFAVCVLIFALLVFSSFLSSITASMTQLRQLSWKFDKNLALLRKYLRTHVISAGLSIRILRYTEYKLSVKKNEVRDTDVFLLTLLSSQLRMELMLETYSPYLDEHPLFHQYMTLIPQAGRELCSKGIQRVSFSIGDLIFMHRKKADKMMFLTQGHLIYSGKSSRHWKNGHVKSGEFFCEAALWTNWEHVGSMRAVENSEVLAVDGAKFADISRMHQRVQDAVVAYSEAYVKWLNEEAEMHQLSDLHTMEQGQLHDMVSEAFAGKYHKQFFGGRFLSNSRNTLANQSKDAMEFDGVEATDEANFEGDEGATLEKDSVGGAEFDEFDPSERPGDQPAEMLQL